MRWILRGCLALLGLLVLASLHYTLPQRDIVRVTGTEIIRQDFSGWNAMFYAQADSGSATGVNRDLRLINTVDANGKVRVYRNEDTGFGWPPYFKLDSSNLQAEAQSLQSSREAPQWIALRHYGWRNEWISIYPNALSLREVSGPDVRLLPVFNTLVLLFLFALAWGVTVRLRRFRRARIDPMIEAVDARLEDAGDDMRGIWARMFGRK